MLVYMSQYVDDRSASPAPSSKSYNKSASVKSKKGKINFVSKASIAVFDPRPAMGIDTGREWHEADCSKPESRSSFDHASRRHARNTEDNDRAHNCTTSPIPELEAFATSVDDVYAYGSSDAAHPTEMTRQPSASSSVFEDDRDVPETPTRRRFLPRNSFAPSASTLSNNSSNPPCYPTDDFLFSPLGTPAKSSRSAGTSVHSTSASSSSSSSFARFFARKKKDKAPSLSGLASRSTPDLFDGVPQSAPPTSLTFEQSGFQFSPQRKGSDVANLHESPSSLRTSPVRQPVRLIHEISSTRFSPLAKKKSMSALRQIREHHNAVGAAPNKSITFANPEEHQRSRKALADARAQAALDVAPALLPLPSFDTSSPMIPIEFAWNSKRGTVRESQMPTLGCNTRPVSRVVSSTGRGVPSPGLNPIRLNDLRKSTISLHGETAPRFSDGTRSTPSKPPLGKSAALPAQGAKPRSETSAAQKRMSMTQRVVDGLLDQNHGREEPEMRARRSDMEVRSARRRSRSVDGRAGHALKLHDLTSPPSSNSHSDSVFPAFVRHAPISPGRSNSPSSRFFGDSEQANAVTPTPRQAASFDTPTSASPNRTSPSSSAGRSPQRHPSAAETQQARRVNFAGQRAKAVAVASPLLRSKSPRMGGRSTTPLPVVNIMPPTPDLAANEEDHERQQAVLQRRESVDVQEAVKATIEAAKVAQVAAVTPSSSVKDDATVSASRDLPSRQDAATSTPAPAPVAASVPAKPANAAAVTPVSPESVYSPASVYLPKSTETTFAALHAGLFGSDDLSTKEELEITADSMAVELSYVGMARTDSVTSELSEASSARSSSSGALAFSRSMSSSSLVSGGTFSSASSNASMSPERKMGYLPSSTSFDFSPTKMSSSASLASSAGTSIFELETEMASGNADLTGALGLAKLKTPFQVKGSSVGGAPGQPSASDSSDCDTPTLASCRQMGTTAVAREQKPQLSEKAALNRQLDLSMDLSDLAQELGLGRLSQIGLAHLKGVDALAEKPAAIAEPTMTLGTVNAAFVKKVLPVKPPKSSARATASAVTAIAAAGTGLARFGVGMNDIASSAAMSPLPVSIAGRSPQTPPRTKLPAVEPTELTTAASGRKVSASGVPKAEGGFGLGLNFAESPSPQSQPRKAAIAPASYSQHKVLHSHIMPASTLQYSHQPPQQQQHYHQNAYEEEEAEWVGVAM
ncbi:uncharacterized protein UBRO_04615 [Ustilago bromivora]|uniref:Uncharacterized protein n=1 Tax=Ustilago bromivora TaxID=307758 RepID=A0A1K0G4J8_9BASI|nr:uncharacterized protein UBRO_04615 [Ustilago bromivora]SYW79428.1 uncharacterized protein UBRO2_03112 [Ustilago bromivora]